MNKGSDERLKEEEMGIPPLVYNSLIGVIWVGISLFGAGIALSEAMIKLGGLVVFCIATAGILWLLYDTIHQNNKLQGKKSSLGMNMAIIGVILEAVIVVSYSINQVQGVEDAISDQFNWVIVGAILIVLGVFFELFLIDVAIMNLVRGFVFNFYNSIKGGVNWVAKYWFKILRIIFTIIGIILLVGAVFSIPTNESLERLIMATVGAVLIISWNWAVVKRSFISISLWSKKRWRGISTTILLVFSVVAWFLPMDIEVRAICSVLSLAGAIGLNWTKVKLALYEIGKGITKFLNSVYLSIKGLIIGTIKRWRGISTTILLVFSVVAWFLPMNIEIRTICSVLGLVGAIGLNWTTVKKAMNKVGKKIAQILKETYLGIKALIHNLGRILRALAQTAGIMLLIISVFTSDPYFKMYYFLAGVGLILLANHEAVIRAHRENLRFSLDLTGLGILYLSLTSLRKMEPEWIAYSGYLLGVALIVLGHTYFFKKTFLYIFKMLYRSARSIFDFIQTTTFAILGLVFFVFAFSVIINNPLFGLDLSEYDTMARTILGMALGLIGVFSFKFAQTRYYVEKGGKRK